MTDEEVLAPSCGGRCPTKGGTCFPDPCKLYIERKARAATSAAPKPPLAGVHDETIYGVLNEVRGQSWFDKCNALEAALVKAGWSPPPGHPLASVGALRSAENGQQPQSDINTNTVDRTL